MNERVHVETAADCTSIHMDDHKVNAMSIEMMQEIDAALDVAEGAKQTTVLRGREGIFSAGFCMKTFAKGPDAGLAMIRDGAELILRLLQFPYPVITVCTGHAYPMGAFLMLSADSRVGITGPWQIGLNEVAISLTIPRFAMELARHRLAPPAFARVQTAYMFTPEGAVAAGYLDRAVDPEAIDAAIEEECARLATLDQGSFTNTKLRVNEPVIHAIESALFAEFGEVA